MFGFLKRRVTQRMQTLLKAAQLATMTQFVHDHSASQDGDLFERAGVVGNHLFGNNMIATQTQFDHSAEYVHAREWLKENPRVRELVVQSLRVANVIGWAKSGTRPEVGLETLNAFGKEFPDSPQLDTYRALLRRFVESLPPSDARQKLMNAV
jgi:hypothetical protein